MLSEALIVLGEYDTDEDILSSGDGAATEDFSQVALSEETWDYRLKQLESVERRSNFDGYELPENVQERRVCMRARSKFLRNLQRELIRRESAPTERDQIESTLMAIIDKVLKSDRISRRKDEGNVREPSWHIATKGHFMSKLQGPDFNLSVTGQDKSSTVTDLPFVDLIITHSAITLPVLASKPSCLIAAINDHAPERIQQEDADISTIADTSLSQPLRRPFILQGVSDLLRRVGYKIKTPPPEIPLYSPIIDEKSKEKEDHCMPPSRSQVMIKGTFTDTVTITVTALLDPPPLFIMRHAQPPLSLPSGINYISNALSTFSPHATSNHASTAVYSDRNDIRHQNTSCSQPTYEQNKLLVGTAGNAGYYSTHCRSSSLPLRTIQVKNADNVYDKEEGRGEREKELKDRLVYDKSARVSFEAQFISEIALSCSLPMDNIHIEEIRHLDLHDSRLAALLEEQRTIRSRQIQHLPGHGSEITVLPSATNKVQAVAADMTREGFIATAELFDDIHDIREGDQYDDIHSGSDEDRYEDDGVDGDNISGDGVSVQSALTPNDSDPPHDHHEGTHEGQEEDRDESLQLSLTNHDSHGVTNRQTCSTILNGSHLGGPSAIADNNASRERNALTAKQRNRLDKIERKAKQVAVAAKESRDALKTFSGVSTLLSTTINDMKYQAGEISTEVTETIQIASDWAGLSGISLPCIPGIIHGISGVEGLSSTPVTGCIKPLMNSMRREKKKGSVSHSTTCTDIVGCEISFTVTVKVEQREQLGILDWEAADVPLLLVRQMMEEKSPLRDGEYTKHILDIRFKRSNSRRTFVKWEDYWCHVLHPVYFGRTALIPEKKHIKSTGIVEFERSKVHNMIKKEHPEDYLLKLVQGMNYKMPCEDFSLRGIKAFLALPSVPQVISMGDKGVRDKWALVGLYPPTPRKKLLIDDYKILLSTGMADQSTADTACALTMIDKAHKREEVGEKEEEDSEGGKDNNDEEEDGEDEKEVLIRVGLKEAPRDFKYNASNVTQHTVDQLELQLIATDAALFNVMKKGLVDGVRLRPEQLTAMRERDAIKRTYLMAKQTYNRQLRMSGIFAVDPNKEVLVITEVKTDNYNRWVREVKREEHRALLLRQKAITDMKSLRRNEAALQSTYATLRYWLVHVLARGHVLDHPDISATEVIVQLNREVIRIKSSTVSVSGISGPRSSVEMASERQRSIVQLNMQILSETKRTKQLFRMITQWVRRVKKLCREGTSQHRNHHHHRRRHAGRSPVNSKSDTDSHSYSAASVESRDPRTGNSDTGITRNTNRYAGNISISRSHENGNENGSRHKGRSHYSGGLIMRAMANRGKNTEAGRASDIYLHQTCHRNDRRRGEDSHDAVLSEGFSFNRQISDLHSINSSVADVHSRERENKRCQSGIVIAPSHHTVDSGSDQESGEELTGVDDEDDVGVLKSISKSYLIAFVETVRLTKMHRSYQQDMMDRRTAATQLEDEAEQDRVRSEVEGHVTEIRTKRVVETERNQRRINSSTSIESHLTQKSSRPIHAAKSHSKRNLHHPKKTELTSNDLNIDPNSPPDLPPELILLEEEVALAEQVCWLPQLLASDCLMNTLQAMQTDDKDILDADSSIDQLPSAVTHSEGDVISMHQLVQYAVIIMELGPAWRNLMATTDLAREIEIAKAIAAQQEEDEYNEYERVLKETELASQEVIASNNDGQEVEGGSKRQHRFKKVNGAATVPPHTHIYVMPPRCTASSMNGQQPNTRPREPFCTACSRFEHLARISEMEAAEVTYRKYLGNAIAKKLTAHDQTVKSAVKNGVLETRLPLPPRLSTYALNISMAHLGVSKLHPALLMSGLSVFSPCTVPPSAVLGASEAPASSTALTAPSPTPVPPSLHLPLPPTTSTAIQMDDVHPIKDIGSSACSVLIRVRYLDATGVYGDLIGSVHLNDEAMKSTTRGARTYPLIQTQMTSSSEHESREKGEKKGDEKEQGGEGPSNTGVIVEASQLIFLQSPFRDRNSKEHSVTESKATLSLRMFSTKLDKSTGECSRWHLEIIQGRHFPIIDTKQTAAFNSLPSGSVPLRDGRSLVGAETVPSDGAVTSHQVGDSGKSLGSLCTVVCEVLWKGSVGNTATSQGSISRLRSIGKSFLSDVREQSDGANSVDTITTDALRREGMHKNPASSVLPTILSTWVHIGCTTRVDICGGTGDYLFTDKVKGSNGSLFDLPPIWILHSRKHPHSSSSSSSMTDSEEASVGDWVPRNHLTRPLSDLITCKKSYVTMRNLAYAVRCWLMLLKRARKRPGTALLRHRHDMQKLLLEAEECERHFMFAEDVRMRCYEMLEEDLKYRDLSRDQVVIYQQFNRLMSLITCPTRTLSRLLFFMGSALNSGGIRVTCLDTAENLTSPRSMLEVFIVPVLYPEDEEEMKRHISAVSSACRSYSGLTPIVELSMHDVTGYTAEGFSMEKTRTAMVILERNEHHPTLSEYLSRKHVVTDCELAGMFIMVLQGLVGLHAEGVIHRNLHEGAVFVLPHPVHTHSPIRTSTRNVTHSNTPICRIGEFWFLENPRAIGCEYSQGRADWGDRSTAAPEARGGYQVSTASDVYAFGLCVLRWVKCLDRQTQVDVCITRESPQAERKRLLQTAAKNAMLGIATSGTIRLPPIEPLRSLSSLVPSRWDTHSWVYHLLHMCLQEDPRHRGTAKDILAFMQSVN